MVCVWSKELSTAAGKGCGTGVGRGESGLSSAKPGRWRRSVAAPGITSLDGVNRAARLKNCSSEAEARIVERVWDDE